MNPDFFRGRSPALRALPILSCVLGLLLVSCRITQDGKEVNTLSFSSQFDSLSRFDSTTIVVTDVPSGAVDTVFKGKVSDISQIRNLVAPHYAGKGAHIEITGFNAGVVVSRVARAFDGSSDSTVTVEVKVLPGSTVTAQVSELQLQVGDREPLPGTRVSPPGLADTSLAWSSSVAEVLVVEGATLVAKSPGKADLIARLASDPVKQAVIHVTVVAKDAFLPPVPVLSGLLPGDAKVTVTWAAVAGAKDYNLYYGEGVAADKSGTRVKVSSSPYEVKTLKNGTTYAFAVSASNAAGESALSPSLTAMPQAAQADALVIDSVLGGNGQITIYWKPVPEALVYSVYYMAGSAVDKTGNRVIGVSSPYVLTGLANGTQFAVAITALTAMGESGLGNVVTARPQSPPLGSLSYAANPCVYWVGRPIAANAALFTGAADSFSVSPALPAGLSLNRATGEITGTPTAASAKAEYTVKAGSSGSGASVLLSVTVNAAPSELAYKVNPAVYGQSVAIATNPATVTGVVDSFTVRPPLPAGLSLSRSTGALSGTPASIAASAKYTVTAHNPAGTTEAEIAIQVNGPPSGFSYVLNPAVCYLGVAIAANPATVSGAVDSFTVSPALPAGLSLDKASGAITGVPTAISAAAAYTVTAHNASASPTVVLAVTVLGPPSGLSYASPSAVYHRSIPIAAHAATVSGAVDSFTVSPSLPPGLSLNKSTGVITGTPSANSIATVHTVSARNPAGVSTFRLTITVTDPVSGLAYAANPAVYVRGIILSPPNSATLSGTPDSFTVSPALPAGLSLNKTTGAISGTPTAAAAQAVYVVTAKAGSVAVSVNLTLTVKEPVASLSYAVNPAVYHRTYAIAANPASIVGAVDSFTVSPALPAGLLLNRSTGTLTGTPTAAASQATYVVTARSGPTSATANLVLAVREPMTAFSYAPEPNTFWMGLAQSPPKLPAITGGAPDSITVSPALPGGLILDRATGGITGTPNTAGGPTVYAFTARGGPVTLTFNWTLTVHTSPRISYPLQSASYPVGTAISDNRPSAVPSGTIDSFKVAPALPAGLSISKATGWITGTPTAPASAADYVVTAWNRAGTGRDTLSIAVRAPATPITLNATADASLDTTNGSYNTGYSAAGLFGKPGQPYFVLFKFNLAGRATAGLQSARVRFKTYGLGNWNGGAPTPVTFKVYRLKSAWTEGTGNWYWHDGQFRNSGEVLLTHYPLSTAITSASTNPAEPTGILHSQADIVRPANLVLAQTQIKTLSYPAASIHPDYSTPFPAPAHLVDLELDMTDYVAGIFNGTFVDHGFIVVVDQPGLGAATWSAVVTKEAGDGNANESDGNHGPKLILQY